MRDRLPVDFLELNDLSVWGQWGVGKGKRKRVVPVMRRATEYRRILGGGASGRSLLSSRACRLISQPTNAEKAAKMKAHGDDIPVADLPHRKKVPRGKQPTDYNTTSTSRTDIEFLSDELDMRSC